MIKINPLISNIFHIFPKSSVMSCFFCGFADGKNKPGWKLEEKKMAPRNGKKDKVAGFGLVI